MGSTSRVSQACNPCRSKKRRCDGTRPVCGLCSRLNTECEYKVFEARHVHGVKVVGHVASPTRQEENEPGSSKKSTPGLNSASSPRNNPDRLSALKANSGALSADLVRQNLGSAPGRNTHTSPWNLGIRTENQACDTKAIFDIVSLSEYDRLVTVYFEKIHILQGTFSEALFNRKKRARWTRATSNELDQPECFDLLFAMVGCMSALFSGGSPYEAPLAECATLHLHQHLLRDGLATYDIDGLILRTLYLRLTTGPRASWLSSCLTMSALQDSLIRSQFGPHSTGMRGVVYEPDRQDAVESTPDILYEKRYRLARNMNDWISNESGRPKAFSGTFPWRNVPISPGLSVGPAGEALTLADMSTRLDPDDYEMDKEGLEKFMDEVLAFTPSHDFVRVSQIMVGGITFRRLRALGAKLSPDQMSDFVAMCCLGLEATTRLAADRQPWHHCANVPFQVLCSFLLLDTRESLSKVAQALSTIRGVYECFPTPTMQNTLQTATHLVDLARQKKERDSADLSMATSSVIGTMSNHDSLVEAGSRVTQGDAMARIRANVDGGDISTGLVEADFSSWDNINWDQVLQNNAILGPL